MLTKAQWDIALEFWTYTLKAHFEAAVLGLTRILLDRDPRTVRLEELPLLMQSKAGQFAGMTNPGDVRSQLIPSVQREVEGLKSMVEPLKKRRDQMLSHNAFQRTLSDREWNIEWADLEAAYSRALKLVNRVYEAYKGHDAMPVTGAKEATVSKELSTIFSFARRSDSDPGGSPVGK